MPSASVLTLRLKQSLLSTNVGGTLSCHGEEVGKLRTETVWNTTLFSEHDPKVPGVYFKMYPLISRTNYYAGIQAEIGPSLHSARNMLYGN